MRAAFSLALAALASGAFSPSLAGPPVFTSKAKYARWLVSNLQAGVLSTTSVHLNGTAFGNPQSFAGDTDGHLYFYTSSLDTSMQDVAKNPNASFALVLEELGNFCTNGRHQFEAKGDPEDPRCARLTVMGAMRVCAPGTEVAAANSTLFAKHPEMKTWPASVSSSCRRFLPHTQPVTLGRHPSPYHVSGIPAATLSRTLPR